MPPTLPTLTLTTPCTVNQLIEFVDHQVRASYSGAQAGAAATVNATSGVITVS